MPRIHVFNLPKSRRQSLLGIPVIAKIICQDLRRKKKFRPCDQWDPATEIRITEKISKSHPMLWVRYGYVMDTAIHMFSWQVCPLHSERFEKKQLPGPGRGILHRTRPCAVSPGHPTVPSTPGITWTNSNVCEPTMVLRCFTYQIYGGFLKWGYPNSWMVRMENLINTWRFTLVHNRSTCARKLKIP